MQPLPDLTLTAILDRMPVARLALRELDDEPAALPIVFARAAGALWSPIDGKRKRGGATLGRLARLERAPRVMLVLDHYHADWSTLWWLRLRCDAQVIVGEHPDWAAAVAALLDKYPQYQTTPLFRDEPILVRLVWTSVAWWTAAPDGLARWLAAQPPVPGTLLGADTAATPGG